MRSIVPFFLLLFFFSKEIYSQAIPSASFYPRGEEVFQELDFEYSNFEFKFEEDLFVKRLNECRNERFPPSCAPCVYNSPTGQCSNLPFGLLPPCPCIPAFCQPPTPEETLIVGVPVSFSPDVLVQSPFRYSHFEREKGFEVSLHLKSGSPKLSFVVSTLPTFSEESILGISLYGHQSVVVCPSDPRFANTFTYFISVFTLEKNIEFEAQIEINLINNTFNPAKESDFTVVGKNGLCISPDLDIENTTIDFQKSAGRVSNCSNLLLVLPLKRPSCRTISIFLDQNGIPLGLTYVLTSSLIQRSVLPNYLEMRPSIIKYHSSPLYFETGENVFSFCPESESDDEISETIFTIELPDYLYGRNLSLYIRDVTENPNIQSVAIGSLLSPLSFQAYLIDSIAMSCPCLPSDHCEEHVPFWTGWADLVDEVFVNETHPDFSRHFSLSGFEDISFRCLDDALRWDWPSYACKIFRVIPVLTAHNPLIYPMPEMAYDLGAFPFRSNFDITRDQKIVNNTIGLLVQTAGTLTTSTTILGEKRLQSCNIRFINPSRFITSTGKPPTSKPFPVAEMGLMSEECDGKAYFEVVDEISSLYRLLDENEGDETGFSPSGSHFYYALAALVFTREYQNCVKPSDLNPFYSFGSLLLNNSRLCFEYDATDPCCNSSLAWTTCCATNDRIQMAEHLPQSVNKDFLKETCNDSDCADLVLEYFQSLIYRLGIEKPCRTLTQVGSITIAAKNCGLEWFGDEKLGYPCATDLDCFNKFRRGECDISVGRCIGVREPMEEGFLFCLLVNSSSLERTILGIFFGEGVELENFLQPQIVSDYGPMSSCKPSIGIAAINGDLFTSCPSCDQVECLMRSTCDIPSQCFDLSETCQITFLSTSQFCEGTVCNWDQTATTQDCLASSHLCMYCYNSSHCVANSTFDQSQCESIDVCVLPDKVFFNVTKKECDELAANKVIPDDFTGFCKDLDYIQDTILRVNRTLPIQTQPLLDSELTGVCLFPLKPQNIPGCPQARNSVYSLDFSTRRGCAVFADCDYDILFALPKNCKWIFRDQSECEGGSGRWLPLPILNKSECLDDTNTYCAEPIFYPFQISKINSENNPGVCEACGEIQTEPGVWVEGKSNARYKFPKPEWKETEMVPPFHVDQSLSFTIIDLVVELVDNIISSLDYSSLARCYYLAPMEPWAYIVEHCLSEDGSAPNNTEEAFLGIFNSENDPSVPVDFGTGVWCPGMNFQSLLANGVLSFGVEELDHCVQSDIFMTWQSQFIGNHTTEPLSLFGDPNLLDRDPVRNDVGASVGVVASDGFFFQLLSNVSIETFYTAEIIVRIDSSNYDPHYSIYDFGSMVPIEQRHRRDQLELRPMNVSVEISSNSLNQIVVRGLIRQEMEFEVSTPATFLILRLPNYESKEKDKLLTTGEEAMLFTFCGLYSLSCVFLFGVFLTVSFLNFSLSNFLMLGFGGTMLCLRAVYIGLYAAEYLQGTSVGAILMVEIPSFLYLAIGGLVVMVFTYTIRNVKSMSNDETQRPYWFGYFAFLGILLCFFVLIVVLMIELQDSTTTEDSCFGWSVEESPSDNIETIRIAYHSLALFLAIITAACLFVLSRKLGDRIGAKIRSTQIRNFAWAIGLGVLCQNIMWVVYSAVNRGSPYLVIPMFFVEAIPLIYLARLIVPQDMRRRYKMRTSSLKASASGRASQGSSSSGGT